jgi:hypothetical protein
MPRQPHGVNRVGGNPILLAHPHPGKPHNALAISHDRGGRTLPSRHLCVDEKIRQLAGAFHAKGAHPVSGARRVYDEPVQATGIDRH